MLRLLKYLIIAPFAIVFLAFAYANREDVVISFNPLETSGSGPLSLQGPLFLVILLAIAVGVVAGSVATWLGQGRHRRAAREYRGEAERLRADLAARGGTPITYSKRA
jgi:uncharacterized integral membrane protein